VWLVMACDGLLEGPAHVIVVGTRDKRHQLGIGRPREADQGRVHAVERSARHETDAKRGAFSHA